LIGKVIYRKGVRIRNKYIRRDQGAGRPASRLQKTVNEFIFGVTGDGDQNILNGTGVKVSIKITRASHPINLRLFSSDLSQ
jgi:hypothetical protein